MSQVSQFLVSYGGLILFLIVFVEQGGVPLPAAPFLLVAGALAADGRINLFAAILSATVGSLAADAFWFYAGHRSKARLFQLFPNWHAIRYAVARKTERSLIVRGFEVLTAAKFLPLGILVPLRAGAFEVGRLRFLLVDGVCSLFYVSVYVLPGFVFHSQLEQLVAIVRRFGALASILLLLLVGGYWSSRILKRIRFRKGHAQKITQSP
jgi:membrane protein DedA with SNARE-associated domain